MSITMEPRVVGQELKASTAEMVPVKMPNDKDEHPDHPGNKVVVAVF